MEDFEKRATQAEQQVKQLNDRVKLLEEILSKLTSLPSQTTTSNSLPTNQMISMEEKQKLVDEDTIKISKVIPPKKARELLKKKDLTLDEKADLLRSVGEECIQEDEVKKLLERKPNPICYDGFEPSGRMHIAQGLLKAVNVNKCTKSGCTFIFWVADWFALMNNKMGGDLEKIRNVGKYMVEVWKACGMEMSNVKFIWCADEINSHSNEYWLRVLDIARRFKLPRLKRCSQIMGRNDDDELFGSQMFYPCMQCADIFHLKADICQLGLDQRKVNMLAREYCDVVNIKNKPIILSHHMLMGLSEGQAKMSKSNPDSAIFMEDSEMDVNSKIKKAYCPPQIVKDNPCLDYLKHIIFAYIDEFQISRKPSNGGDKTYTSYEELEEDYAKGALHPGDLKPALAKAINSLLQPVRDHFKNNAEAKKLLEKVRGYQVTK